MLLHDNYIPFIVNLQAVVVFHSEVKCTNCIFCFECISIMADNDKTLIGDGNLSNNNRKSSAPSIVPSSAGTMHSDTHPTHQVAVSEPTTLKRKQTSFQITSVTVKGSRLSTEGGEDSADDLDESHTEEVSSDVLDCSRTTDVDNDQLSECSNVNNDESSVHAPSIPVKCKTEQSVEQDAQTNANKFPSESSKDDKLTVPPSEKNQSQHVVKPPALPDQWQHRFRVVKIVSSEPFKRGRWLCMDFMDPPAPAVEAKPEVSDSTPSSGTQIIPSTYFPDSTVPTDRVAHIYEISPSDAYPGSISVAVGPDHIQQPMYGIFLPVNNGQYPFISGINTTTVSIQEEVKRPEPTQSTTTLTIQQPQGLTTSQTFTEAQPPFPCQQTQSVSTPASQTVQPPTTVQVCPQHQSQTTVKAPTSATTIQQSAVSAPIIPVPTPVTSTQTAIPPPQSQAIQESQITMQQWVQPPVVPQSYSVPISTTQALSVASSNATVISSTSQVCDLQQNVVNPPAVQQTVVNPPAVQQTVVNPPAVQQTVANPPAVQQTVVNPSAVQQTVVNPPAVQQTVMNPPAAQQTVVNPPAVQQTVVNPPAVQQNVVNPPAVQQNVVNPPAVQHNVVNPPALQQTVVNPPALQQTVVNPPVLSNASMAGAQTSSVGTQASAAASNIPEVTLAPSITNTEPAAVPSQVVQNHVEVKELGTPPSTNPEQIPESTNEVPPAKSDINGEDPESVPSGTSTVAIDNKIEQAMDLVKSHLMFAVREEVDVLKEKITELMDRISQLEYENGFLRANASQQTLEQLNQSQLLQQQQQQNQPSTVSMNSIQVTQQPTSQQLNIQNPQSTS